MSNFTLFTVVDDVCGSRFGLYLVDFKSPNKTRTAKDSAKLYASVIRSRSLPADYDPEDFTAFSGAALLAPSILPLLCIHRLLL
ncbi:glycosyl hydrolase family protein [Macrococcus caseolyticus]|nr:glycosyl hydrolase family protein [Macrococcus caseolyticus]RKO11303.1 glycosyl hydrolase family protein [Macrococcus caseolyticus]